MDTCLHCDMRRPGFDMIPALPNVCECGIGYTNGEFPHGKQPVLDFCTTMYTRNAPFSCKVFYRECLGQGPCRVEYSGEQDCVHFWTKQTAAGDEIGWDFVSRVTLSKISFSAFCTDLTRMYRSLECRSAAFMSKSTFVSWFFSWASRMQIDFRKDVDPWCRPNPKVLAGDGTHIGIAASRLQILPIENSEVDVIVNPQHKRFDRVFLPYSQGHSQDHVRQARKHLAYLSNKVLGKITQTEFLGQLLEEENNRILRDVGPVDQRSQFVLNKFIDREYEPSVLQSLATVFKILSAEAALSAFIPHRYHDQLLSCCDIVSVGGDSRADLQNMRKYCPEFRELLNEAQRSEVHMEICQFLRYLVATVENIHSTDPPPSHAAVIPGTYNPSKGTAYYFTEHGCQVRKNPTYGMNQKDDSASDKGRCKKQYPCISTGGYSYAFFWFCPIHGHCFGFHIINGSEGRKDPFSSLMKYLPEAPDEVFYDFACGLNEYSLNREPHHFQNTRFWHDIFHGFKHKCPPVFRSSRISGIKVNSEICEQFNAFIQCVKYTGTHLSKEHFSFFVQFFTHQWNEKKTVNFNKKVDVAINGTR
jgi:hypothetical protein